MSNLKWPPYAKDESGKQYTPCEAKAALDKTFTILNHVVIPRCGEVNTPHWACPNGSSYSTIRQGWEMSPWHFKQQEEARQLGLIIEHPIYWNNTLLVADAYDPVTNTVIEYVWSHFDASKIGKYFELGLSQTWVFPSKFGNYADQFTNTRNEQKFVRIHQLCGVNTKIGLPDILVEYR